MNETDLRGGQISQKHLKYLFCGQVLSFSESFQFPVHILAHLLLEGMLLTLDCLLCNSPQVTCNALSQF